jgi:hypothetical protein
MLRGRWILFILFAPATSDPLISFTSNWYLCTTRSCLTHRKLVNVVNNVPISAASSPYRLPHERDLQGG